MKISMLFILIVTFVGIHAEENQKKSLTDYLGQYAFVDENATTDNVLVELHSDSTLKATAAIGSVTLKFIKDDEFEIAEYGGQVLFIRDEEKQNVIGVKVIVPSANIEKDGKKEQLVSAE